MDKIEPANLSSNVFTINYFNDIITYLIGKDDAMTDEEKLKEIQEKLQSEEYVSLSNVCETLSKIAKGRLDLSEHILDAVKTAVQSEKNNWLSLKYIHSTLERIVEVRPEFDEQILGIFKTSLQSEENNKLTLCQVNRTLGKIIEAHPEFAEQILDMVKTALQSGKNTEVSLREAAETLGKIVEARPEFAEQILDMVKTTPQSEKNNKIFLYNACEILQSPNWREKASDLSFLRGYAENTLSLISRCLKSVPFEKLEPDKRSNEEQTVLQAAYKMRFSTKQEVSYLSDKFSISEIAQMKLSAQQRCMNILIGSLGKEQNLPEVETAGYRKNPGQSGVYTNNADWLTPASFKAAELFGCYFPAYLKKTQGYFSTHDAVYWLPEPMTAEKNASFARFMQNNLVYADIDGTKKARRLAELNIISKSWKYLKPEQEKLKYKELLAVCQSCKYENQEFDKFAVEAARCGVHEADYKNYESIYKAGLKVPEPFDSSKEFKFGKYTGRFLPRDDVRTGFFGEHTDCCQHFGGVGNSCAVSTVMDDYSQLFVIENDKGQIVSGSWAWQNTAGKYREVCFDNIEAIGEYASNPVVNKIYEQAGRYLTQEADCRRVTIGLGYQDADVSQYKTTEAIPLPRRYQNQYSDAQSQVLLAENPQARPLDKTQESRRYIRDVCFLDIDAMENIAEKCFPSSDQELQTPENLSGLALVDEAKGVVGYCLYDAQKREIYDMAVLPEYRKDKNGSSTKLFGEIIRRVKNLGGEWSAELRDKTTYRFMEAMEKRGLVQMQSKGFDHAMSDGSNVYSVKFKPIMLQKAPVQNQMLKISGQSQR